eukprot:Selendium_serpulae@DN3615_c0_g1_i1.p1
MKLTKFLLFSAAIFFLVQFERTIVNAHEFADDDDDDDEFDYGTVATKTQNSGSAVSDDVVVEDSGDKSEVQPPKDDNSIDDDDEELDRSGMDGSTQYKPRRRATRSTDQKELPLNSPFRWIVEICVFIAFNLALVHMHFGKKRNEEIASAWFEGTAPFFESQFASTRIDNKNDIVARGWHMYECFATGRRNCQYCLTLLECLPRQCPWMLWGFCNVVPAGDSARLEIPLDNMGSFIVCIARKRSAKRIATENKDVAACACRRVVPGLTSDLVVLSDCQEAVDKLLSASIIQQLNKSAPNIRSIVVSDALASDRKVNHQMLVRVELLLPSTTDSQEMGAEMKAPLNAIFAIVDEAPFVKLSEKTKIEVRKARENLSKMTTEEEDEARATELAKRREDKAREEDERIERMTPDQQRKYDERQQKRQIKQRQPRIKIK